MQTFWGVLSVLFIMALLFPLFAIGAIYAYLSGMIFLQPVILAVYLSFGAFLVMSRFELYRFKKFFIIGASAVVAISLAFAAPGIYDKTRPVFNDGQVDLAEYQPFAEMTKAVTLDGPAALQIEDELPVIDGATALYPIYSAFAQAVYPEKEYQPYGSEVMSSGTGAAYVESYQWKSGYHFRIGAIEDIS